MSFIKIGGSVLALQCEHNCKYLVGSGLYMSYLELKIIVDNCFVNKEVGVLDHVPSEVHQSARACRCPSEHQ